jgi:hypothetical protein
VNTNNKPTTLRLLTALFLLAMPACSFAYDEHSVESTTIEYYEIQTNPDDTQKLSHLKIHSENEYHTDEQDTDFPPPAPAQDDAGSRYTRSLMVL